ncbi:di-heme oxidoredictase family protein [Pseudoalteromonas fenneropenaei]
MTITTMRRPRSKVRALLIAVAALAVPQTQAAVGNLLWEDNFNSLDQAIWNIDTGDGCAQGLCGWGNQELQWYSENNIRIEDISGEAGNKGLVIEARREAMGGKSFTSGKIQSSNKLAIKYGMVEMRMKVSSVEMGLWPALWMLGTSTASWPAKGEIDIMEMGQSAQGRADAGFPGAPMNNYTGSNLIFYTDAACSAGNPTCAASLAWQNDNAHVSSQPLTDRFVTYRLYWTSQAIRFAVVDNGIEYDMYDAPFYIDAESSEFREPFYLLMNLAVGGNFTDARSDDQVSAPLPGKMVVDYVRVYQLDGQGEVFIGNTTAPEHGTFGVFTDNTPTSNKLTLGESSDFYVWNQTSISAGSTAPYEGSSVIAWNYTPNQWFGGGFQARQARDMSAFVDGEVRFKIKIPANVAFRVGIADTYTNENWLTFPANTTTYGLVRNGEWAEAVIPVRDLAGPLIALQSIKNHFNIVSVDGQIPTSAFAMAIDDVVWTGGGAGPALDSDGDGVNDSVDLCPNTPANTPVDSNGCPTTTLIDLTDLAGELSAQYNDSPRGEGRDKVIDNNINSKYLTFHNSTWLQFKANGGAYVAKGYQLTSANDFAERDPLNWSLQGSNDGQNWQVLDSRSNEDFPGRFATREFTFNNQTAYQFYRLTMSNNSGNITQLAEWAILAEAGAQVVDSDGDGVADSADICPNTPTGTAVDGSGCPIDSDGDGIPDSQDQCANTPTGSAVDSNGCPIVQLPYGVAQLDASSVQFYVNTSDWADVHYRVNGGGQQNVRMVIAGGRNTLTLSNLTTGDSIEYWFTYQTSTGAVDTSAQTFTLGGGSTQPGTDSDGDGVPDNADNCPNTPAGTAVDGQGCPLASGGNVVPLYSASTPLEQAIQFDRGDALVTRFADRGRDRHAKEDQFQSYDHYLSHYWTHRTAQFQFVDYVAKGGNSLEITFITEWPLNEREFRAWYRGLNTVAEYHGNYFGINGAVQELDHGSYDYNFNKISDNGTQYRYRLIINDYRPLNWDPGQSGFLPLQIGQRMEFEASQFLLAAPEGRDNYYGTTYLYIIGQGLVPWQTKGNFDNKSSEREDSYPIAQSAWLGGGTTLPYNYTNEPDNHFMQMATNLSNLNGQVFVEGRRVHHSSFVDGQHDEHGGENGVFAQVVGKAGPHYINHSCVGCHARNGRAAPPAIGESLDKWVFKVADANGNPHPLLGKVLQPNTFGISSSDSEGTVIISSWNENNGLRSPNFQFSKTTPARFSARIAPQLVGMGLLEAIAEETILAREDQNDANGDGISGKANRIADPQSGVTRLGRFGWKAATVSLQHQVASAFNTDMGVTSSLLPNPDCGSAQSNCGNSGVEVSDTDLNKLVKYLALLGVRAQRSAEDAQVQQGKAVFKQIGCEQCHVESMQTSAYHPLAELRNQTIHAYTDLLLHDMGSGLADNLGEGDASGAEWRTPPLWGLGLSACVTGGVDNVLGGQGNEFCTPKHSYLHDGRARSIEEAILWHGGEANAAKIAYETRSSADKSALLAFLNSL